MTRTRKNPLFPYQEGYPSTWRGRYPGLIEGESILLTRYLDGPGQDIEQLWYNVRMDGVPGRSTAEEAPNDSEGAMLDRIDFMLTARRADALALRAGVYQIIELRALAEAQTIGELITYRSLAMSEWPTLPWGNAILVASSCSPIITRVLEQHNFEIYLDTAAGVQPTVPLPGITR